MKYKYPFTNSVVFALVMQEDPELCRDLLQLIFPDRQIQKVRPRTGFPDAEHTIIPGIDIHQIRLDVLFKDSEAWYDIEMQVRDENDLPKRTRYTHAAMDTERLNRGDEYSELIPGYVIFLCCFDQFEKNRPVYRFHMYDPKNSLPLGDESYTIILNSRCDDPTVPKPLRELFRYMNESEVSEGNQLLRRIDDSVADWNRGGKVRQIMTLEQEIQMRENKIRKEAREQGRAEEREKNVSELMKNLGLTREEAIRALGVAI
ncbi:MAG: Rpn family recombination-promoting nuclease/putative transposase [Firmicutes bacterium]|nr:Rpn family recombination-promoting nuclease/putative transposase [Bacillota bacterium]